MRKITLLLLISFIGIGVYAQQNGAKNFSKAGLFADKNRIKATNSTNKSANAYISESFESATFPPSGWTLLNPAGGTGWSRQLENTNPAPGWNSPIAIPATSAGTAVAVANYTTGGSGTVGDQWLISPSITISSGDVLTCQLWVLMAGYNDSLDILLSTTNNTSTSAFTTVLASYDTLDFTAQTWMPVSINLTSYAGQTVYIAFREHIADNQADGAFFALDAVGIGTAPAADVEVQSIDIPALNTSTTITPMATVGNAGSSAQTFTVDMTITPGGYTSTQTVTNLAAGGSQQVSFASFTGTNNTNYSVTVTTTLTGDANTANNTMTSTFTIYQADPILYDNTNISIDNSIVSTLFGGLPTGQDLISCADDFVIPSGSLPWTITCIKTTGSTSAMAASTTIDRFTYEIYNNNNNKPGTILNTGSITTVLEGTNLGTTQTLVLATPITLNPGTYWLSVYAEYDTATVATSCRWNWDCGPTVIGMNAQIQATNSLFGAPFTWAILSGLVTGEESFSFILYGTNGTNVNNNNLAPVEVYPNPSNGTLNITNANNANVIVYNLLGEVVSNTISTSAFNTIDLSNLSNGSYIVKVITNDNTITKKINIVK